MGLSSLLSQVYFAVGVLVEDSVLKSLSNPPTPGAQSSVDGNFKSADSAVSVYLIDGTLESTDFSVDVLVDDSVLKSHLETPSTVGAQSSNHQGINDLPATLVKEDSTQNELPTDVLTDQNSDVKVKSDTISSLYAPPTIHYAESKFLSSDDYHDQQP